MSRFKFPFFVLLVVFRTAIAAENLSSASLAGAWQIDLARSTELSPWKDYKLRISVEGDKITFDRNLGAGARGYADTMTVQVGQTVTVPVEMWPDNRNLGAYIGDDHNKRVHAEWVVDKHLLRVSSDLTLSTQQGPHAINILSDYQLSPSGKELVLTELRSSRNRPIVFVFNRIPTQP